VESIDKQKIERQQPRHAEKTEIEYEIVSLRVPKQIMDVLRKLPAYPPNPVEWLEYAVVDMVRADLEAASGEELINWFDLGPIFKAVLHDKRF
jgi:hypothetical protein